jgi:BirA family biotin operon repressor/biotin-[acetyl-CoA-carboxylase] ligase
VSSPYTDLDRPPLREAALRRALVVPGGLWTDLRVVAETASTNADLATAAREGGALAGTVLVAEAQTAGKGRLGRSWVSPPRAGIAVSVLLRPRGAAVSRQNWLPLLAGVALVEAVRRVSDVDAALKWPNDLLVDGRKCAGILAEAVPEHGVIVGIGLNTTLRESELPHPGATSLQLAGAACADRDPLLRAVLRRLEDWYTRWHNADGDPTTSGLWEAYKLHCATLGRDVRVELPGGATLSGTADRVDQDGRLVVAGTAVAAGDVVHLR